MQITFIRSLKVNRDKKDVFIVNENENGFKIGYVLKGMFFNITPTMAGKLKIKLNKSNRIDDRTVKSVISSFYTKLGYEDTYNLKSVTQYQVF